MDIQPAGVNYMILALSDAHLRGVLLGEKVENVPGVNEQLRLARSTGGARVRPEQPRAQARRQARWRTRTPGRPHAPVRERVERRGDQPRRRPALRVGKGAHRLDQGVPEPLLPTLGVSVTPSVYMSTVPPGASGTVTSERRSGVDRAEQQPGRAQLLARRPSRLSSGSGWPPTASVSSLPRSSRRPSSPARPAGAGAAPCSRGAGRPGRGSNAAPSSPCGARATSARPRPRPCP